MFLLFTGGFQFANSSTINENGIVDDGPEINIDTPSYADFLEQVKSIGESRSSSQETLICGSSNSDDAFISSAKKRKKQESPKTGTVIIGNPTGRSWTFWPNGVPDQDQWGSSMDENSD